MSSHSIIMEIFFYSYRSILSFNFISRVVPHPSHPKKSHVFMADNRAQRRLAPRISPGTPYYSLLEQIHLINNGAQGPLVSPDTSHHSLLAKSLLIAHNRTQQVAPLVSPDTPSHCTSHIQSTTLTVQPLSRTRHLGRFTDKRGDVIPPLVDRSSSPMSNRTRQRLLEARKRAMSESVRTGRRVTIMDVILDSAPPLTTVQPYCCAAKSSYRPRMQKTYAPKAPLGKMELYRFKQNHITTLAMQKARGRTGPNVSAERSTSLWPPNIG
ncbi:uncharacterized protein EDB91DRAFT_523368 [Suillus paluster]|uniref:uncharacterized protein n=1 Tax=Suillus paluster TaxID=48578 RepID=UPI001B87DAAF|nr:uncharacterized protein EDB91DRAFT_523368 [Suillus paluster]KAG1752539.1 hypothetical protein EDB91DRAFT_523368 [Suillus paluster]